MTPDGYAHRVLWRAFPRDIDAPDAAPFSPRSVTTPRFQNIGRFDQRGRPPVLYLADSPAHATTEILRRRLRSAAGADRHRITDADLVESGHRRALVSVRIRPFVADRLPDTSEGRVLDRPGIRADQLSLNSYRTSQAAARQIYEHSDSSGPAGSAATGTSSSSSWTAPPSRTSRTAPPSAFTWHTRR